MGISVSARAVDFIPMAGLRFGGVSSNYDDSAASFGGIIDFPLPQYGSRAIELYFSRQQLAPRSAPSAPLPDMSVSILHLGLADTRSGDDPRLSWLLIGSAGATRFATGASSDTRPSIGLGGAVRWMVSEHFGVRGDLRALINFTGTNGTVIACNGGCSLFYAGTIVVQGEATVGVVVRF
ncbi:MAG TPA: hypothetical protein VGH12_02810 [Steroidobacteraceae bacterium]|jgi:hypothetical protein